MQKLSVANLTISQKLRLLCSKGFWYTMDFDGLLPSVSVSDGPVGVRAERKNEKGETITLSSVSYPSAQSLANSWDVSLAEEMGECLADDCYEKEVDILLDPGFNIKRHPLNGRNFEYFSEDPYLAGMMAKSYIEGVQSRGIGTCLKHFCCNNLEYNRFEQSSDVDERTLREIYYVHATVILPATHDTASAVLAAPIEEESPYISSGTWSLLGIEQTKAHTDEFSKKANYSNEGSIGYGFRYQKNIMGLWLIQNVRKELGNPSFETLTQMAKCKEDCGVIDVNDKRFLSPKNMTAEINKALGKSLNSASIMRVIYDSLAISYADAIAELERNTGKTYKTLNIIGGGSRDTLLNELTAKAIGKKVITGPTEATALGNIVMQMIGIGELKDLAEARRIIKQSFEIREVQ